MIDDRPICMNCEEAKSDAVYNGSDYFCAACALNYQRSIMRPHTLSFIHNAHIQPGYQAGTGNAKRH